MFRDNPSLDGGAQPAPEAAGGDGFEWAVVEIFGHRRHAGRIREEERFGAKMLRIDVPDVFLLSATDADGGISISTALRGWTTHWYGGASIFSLTMTDEASVMRINRPYAAPGRYIPPPADEPNDEGEWADMPGEMP
jgi:hypothetical protein